MTSRAPRGASGGVSQRGRQTPARRTTPQVRGKIDLPRSRSSSLDDQSAGKARLRVFICHKCGTAEQVPWCGQRPNCGHPHCVAALEKCAAAHRDPADPRRFHGPVSLAQIDERLYSATDEAR
jgi:hypothetical protein